MMHFCTHLLEGWFLLRIGEVRNKLSKFLSKVYSYVVWYQRPEKMKGYIQIRHPMGSVANSYFFYRHVTYFSFKQNC